MAENTRGDDAAPSGARTTAPLRASAPLGLGADAVTLVELVDRALVTIALSGDAVRERLARAFGVALPAVGESVVARGGERLLGLQADRLYVMFARTDGGAQGDEDRSDPAHDLGRESDSGRDPERVLRERIAARDVDDARRAEASRSTDPEATATDAASDTGGDDDPDADRTLLYSSDQSDSWVVLRLDGPASRRALERVCPLDLHRDEYSIGAVARSVVEHLGVIVLRESEDGFVLLSPRSSARSFLHEIETSIRYLGDAH